MKMKMSCFHEEVMKRKETSAFTVSCGLSER